MLSSIALCAWAAIVAAVAADARTLRFRAQQETPVSTPPHASVPGCPCLTLLQEHGHAAQAPPQSCPCLNTPPPLIDPEQVHVMKVRAAADDATAQGLAKIQEAAREATMQVQSQLAMVTMDMIKERARETLSMTEQTQMASLKEKVESEMTRQDLELATLRQQSAVKAEENTNHVRETAEEYASNTAKNYIYLHGGPALAAAAHMAQQTAVVRQESTELAKATIKSAANSLEVAQKAQAVITMIPKGSLKKAEKQAIKSRKEQQVLAVDMETIEQSVRQMARVAKEGYDMALRTLDEAKAAEIKAKESLETSRGNALKIEKLKQRSVYVREKSNNAMDHLMQEHR